MKQKALFSILHCQFAVNEPCFVHQLFVFETGQSVTYELCTYRREITKKNPPNQSTASYSSLYKTKKNCISTEKTKPQKWKNSSLSYKVQYAFTFP